jgi:hypothetical protein
MTKYLAEISKDPVPNIFLKIEPFLSSLNSFFENLFENLEKWLKTL